MTISPGLLQVIIYAATALVALAPGILIVLWLHDLRGGKIW